MLDGQTPLVSRKSPARDFSEQDIDGRYIDFVDRQS